MKEHARIQVYVNLEKHLLLCVANSTIKEKFDLSAYGSYMPLIKYDGGAHKVAKIMVNT